MGNLVYSKIDYTKKSGHEQGITSQLNKKQEFGRGGGGQINNFFEILEKLIAWKEQYLAKFTILAKFSKVKSTIFHPS